MDCVVALQRLAIGYARQDQALLAGLDAELHTHELVCLMGPNGTGKTTLMRTILGVQMPLAGTVYLQGRDVQQLSRRHMAQRVSVVLPGRVLAGHLRVEELVALGRLPYTSWMGRYSQQDRYKAAAALEMVEAASLTGRRVDELSDGERQRVLIARALAQETPLLLLDEPTAFLDVSNRMRITRLLQRLARDEGKTILMSTHDLDLALHHADRMWLILAAAHRIAVGAPEDMMLSGALQEALARDDERFDPVSGALHVQRGGGPRVTVAGASTELVWTRRALQRAGFQVHADPDTGCVAEIGYDGASSAWILTRPDGTRSTHASVYDLLDATRKATGWHARSTVREESST